MGVFNFTIVKGEDFSMELLVRDKDTHDPIDIKDMAFEGMCRDNINSDVVLFGFLFTKHTDTTTGIVTASVPRGITGVLVPSAGVYDIFTMENNIRRPFMAGKITFRTASTR